MFTLLAVVVAVTAVVLVSALAWKLERRVRDEREAKHRRYAQPLRDACIDERLFMFPLLGEEEGSDAEPIYRYFYLRTGEYLYLTPGGKFFEWQDDVYNGPPLHAPLGGMIMAGMKCRSLVEIDRARALANLEKR